MQQDNNEEFDDEAFQQKQEEFEAFLQLPETQEQLKRERSVMEALAKKRQAQLNTLIENYTDRLPPADHKFMYGAQITDEGMKLRHGMQLTFHDLGPEEAINLAFDIYELVAMKYIPKQ